jgi:hypothetical protein
MVEAVAADGRRVELHADGTWTVSPGPSTNQETAFRKVPWGASRAQVRASEGREPDAEDHNALGYSVSVAGLAALALFIFVADTLVRAKYVISEPHADYALNVQDFSRLEELLTSKYGPAREKNEFWVNDLYQDSPLEFGMAVAAGHMKRYYKWTIGETVVLLALTGDNYEVNVEVEYVSERFESLEQEQWRSAALDDL